MECNRCKRLLNPTTHRRDSYKVEAYQLFTGETAPVTMREEGDEEYKFIKISSPRIVTICDICMKDAEVIKAMESFEAPPGV